MRSVLQLRAKYSCQKEEGRIFWHNLKLPALPSFSSPLAITNAGLSFSFSKKKKKGFSEREPI